MKNYGGLGGLKRVAQVLGSIKAECVLDCFFVDDYHSASLFASLWFPSVIGCSHTARLFSPPLLFQPQLSFSVSSCYEKTLSSLFSSFVSLLLLLHISIHSPVPKLLLYLPLQVQLLAFI